MGETDGVGPPVHADRQTIERWFLRRGLPHLIEGYNAREDVFTRAAPLLTVVFVAEILLGLNNQFTVLANVGSVLGGAVIALSGFAAANRIRGRRAFQRPDVIGTYELVAFVAVPPVIPLVFGGQVVQAAEVLVGNALLLGLVYVITSYGVLPMSRWALGHVARQLGNLGNLVIRSLPLLLLFSMFLFFNAELWKIMDDLPTLQWWAAVGLLVALGSAFVAFRAPRDLAEMATFTSWDEVRAICRCTSVGGVFDTVTPAGTPAPAPLERSARGNVTLVLFVAQATQIALVTAMIFAFYLVFGLLTIIPSTIEQWTGSAALQQVVSLRAGGLDVGLTVELLRTAAFIATVSGLQFTVAALTDSTYRSEFRDEAVGDVREALAVRSLYLEIVRPPS